MKGVIRIALLMIATSIVSFAGTLYEYTIYINNFPEALIIIEKEKGNLRVAYKSITKVDLPFFANVKEINLIKLGEEDVVGNLEIDNQKTEVLYDLSSMSKRDLLKIGLNPQRAKRKSIIVFPDGRKSIIDKLPVHTFESAIFLKPDGKFYLLEPMSNFKVLFVKKDYVKLSKIGTCETREYSYSLARRPQKLFSVYDYKGLPVKITSGSGKWEIKLTGFGKERKFKLNYYKEIDDLLSDKVKNIIDDINISNENLQLQEQPTDIRRFYAIKSFKASTEISQEKLKEKLESFLEDLSLKYEISKLGESDAIITFKTSDICKTYFKRLKDKEAGSESVQPKEITSGCSHMVILFEGSFTRAIPEEGECKEEDFYEDVLKDIKKEYELLQITTLEGIIGDFKNVILDEGNIEVDVEESKGGYGCIIEYKAEAIAPINRERLVGKFIRSAIDQDFVKKIYIRDNTTKVAIDISNLKEDICRSMVQADGDIEIKAKGNKCIFSGRITKDLEDLRKNFIEEIYEQYPQLKILGRKPKIISGKRKYQVKFELIERFNRCGDL